MKVVLLILFTITANITIANMASPYDNGTLSSSPFSSKNIDILSENILIKIDRKFQTAQYFIEYTIKNEKDGVQIPLLFYAKDYKENFKVWVDDKEVIILNIPEDYIEKENSQFNDFTYLFNEDEVLDKDQYIKFYWGDKYSFLTNFKDLKYFDAVLSRGKHKIQVEYSANVWTDNSDWVKEYSFRYSLSPAKHWKSFGKLNITIIQEMQRKLAINLGIPFAGKIGKISKWSFEKLPKENIEIIYKPEINNVSKILISIGPFRLMLILGIIVFIIIF